LSQLRLRVVRVQSNACFVLDENFRSSYDVARERSLWYFISTIARFQRGNCSAMTHCYQYHIHQ
jgi:hypothetical protein